MEISERRVERKIHIVQRKKASEKKIRKKQKRCSIAECRRIEAKELISQTRWEIKGKKGKKKGKKERGELHGVVYVTVNNLGDKLTHFMSKINIGLEVM